MYNPSSDIIVISLPFTNSLKEPLRSHDRGQSRRCEPRSGPDIADGLPCLLWMRYVGGSGACLAAEPC
jgi:hypothetical protein